MTSVALVLWRSFGLCFLRASITGGHCHAPLHSLHGLPRYLVTRVINIYKLGHWPSQLESGNVHHSKQVSGFLFHHGHLGLRWLLLVDTARADWGYEACHPTGTLLRPSIPRWRHPFPFFCTLKQRQRWRGSGFGLC